MSMSEGKMTRGRGFIVGHKRRDHKKSDKPWKESDWVSSHSRMTHRTHPPHFVLLFFLYEWKSLCGLPFQIVMMMRTTSEKMGQETQSTLQGSASRCYSCVLYSSGNPLGKKHTFLMMIIIPLYSKAKKLNGNRGKYYTHITISLSLSATREH